MGVKPSLTLTESQDIATISSVFAQNSEVGEYLVRDEEAGGSNPLVPTLLGISPPSFLSYTVRS